MLIMKACDIKTLIRRHPGKVSFYGMVRSSRKFQAYRIPGIAKNQDEPTRFPTPGSLIRDAAAKVGEGAPTCPVVNVGFLKGHGEMLGHPYFIFLAAETDGGWCAHLVVSDSL